MRTRNWTDQAGADRYTTEIAVDELKMLGQRPEGAGAENDQTYRAPAPSGPANPPPATVATGGDCDNIPFVRPAALNGLAFPYESP